MAVPSDVVEPNEACVRRFSAFTHGLDSLVEWLKTCGVTTGSAGEHRSLYWIPLHQKLEEAGLEVVSLTHGT